MRGGSGTEQAESRFDDAFCAAHLCERPLLDCRCRNAAPMALKATPGRQSDRRAAPVLPPAVCSGSCMRPDSPAACSGLLPRALGPPVFFGGG